MCHMAKGSADRSHEEMMKIVHARDAQYARYGASKLYPGANWNAADGGTAGQIRDCNSPSAGYAANEGFRED